MIFLKRIIFNTRFKYCRTFKNALLRIFIVSDLIGLACKADNGCDCISTFTYKTPKNQIRYIVKCYLNGEDVGVLENLAVKNQEEANKRTKDFMENYNIKNNSCVVLPNGKMVVVPTQ